MKTNDGRVERIPGGRIPGPPLEPPAFTVRNGLMLAVGGLLLSLLVFKGALPESLVLTVAFWILGIVLLGVTDAIRPGLGIFEESFTPDGYERRQGGKVVSSFEWDRVDTVELIEPSGDVPTVPKLWVSLDGPPNLEMFEFSSGLGKREWVICNFPAMPREDRERVLRSILDGTFNLPHFKPNFRRRPYISFPPGKGT